MVRPRMFLTQYLSKDNQTQQHILAHPRFHPNAQILWCAARDSNSMIRKVWGSRDIIVMLWWGRVQLTVALATGQASRTRESQENSRSYKRENRGQEF